MAEAIIAGRKQVFPIELRIYNIKLQRQHGGTVMKVNLARPDITQAEIDAVLDVLNSYTLALGPKMMEFEMAIASYCGRKHGIAVNSGTSGLHLLVRAYDIGQGDEVITTPFSFIASSNCILYEGAKPVFVDIEPDTANIDPDLIEAAITPKTKAILAVDAFGQPAKVDVIREIARRNDLVFIEDSCEAIGSHYKGKPAGGPDFADAAVFAFYPNKQITTGEGGMVVTDDDRIAFLCSSMRNQGRGEEHSVTTRPEPRLSSTVRKPPKDSKDSIIIGKPEPTPFINFLSSAVAEVKPGIIAWLLAGMPGP
jgi:dTDP-4-amino-4,6-dideoxygalactose transaminase